MSTPLPVFSGKVERRELAFDRPDVVGDYLQGLDGQIVEVVIRKPRSQRSSDANRYYFGVVVNLLAETFGYEKQEMHEVLAMHFLRMADCPVTGAPRRKRTPQCDTKEFSEYVDACIRLGAEHGVSIPMPNDCDFAEAVGGVAK